MSTTDKVTIYDEPCPCGAGRIAITECTPDHPYARPNQVWYQTLFDCAVCRSKYKLQEIGNRGRKKFKLDTIDSDGASIDLV